MLAALHVLGVVTAQHLDRITGVRGAGAEQVVQIAHHAGHAGGAVHVFVEDGFNTLALIGAQVPIAAAGVKHAGGSIQIDLVHIRVPVAGKVFDGCPIGGQGDVLDQHIAAVQRIPVTAAVLECGQHFVRVGAADAPDKVRVLLSTLIGGTYLALFTLRDIHNAVRKQSGLARSCRVRRKMPNLIHQKVADAAQIEVVGAGFTTDRPGVGILKITILRSALIGAAVIHPDGAESCLLVGVRPGGGEGLPNRKRIGEIGGGTVLHIGRCGGCIPAGLQDVQFFRAVLDVFAVLPMTAASGKNQAGGIAGKHRTGIHVAAVGTHQLVHVPVAGVGNPAVQGVIPGGGVVRVDAGFIQIGAEGIVVGTRVCVQGIVAHHHAVALGDVVLQLPVSLAGNIRFLVGANAPGKAIHAIVAFRVYQVAGGIAVEVFAVDSINLDMDVFIRGVTEPAV